MLGSDMVALCASRFDDASNAIHSSAEWLSYLNAAYRDFVQMTRPASLVAEANLSLSAGGKTVALSSAMAQGGVVAVFLADGTPLDEEPANVPWKTEQFYRDQPSVPLWWEQVGARLSVLPSPVANQTLSVAYMTAPTAILTGTSPLIPETFHDALVAGALARAYRDDGSPALAKEYDGEFDRYVSAATKDAALATEGDAATSTFPSVP